MLESRHNTLSHWTVFYCNISSMKVLMLCAISSPVNPSVSMAPLLTLDCQILLSSTVDSVANRSLIMSIYSTKYYAK